jgi:anti-sigma B factor antagonist
MTISTTGTDVVVALIRAKTLDASNSRDFRSAVEYLFKPGAKLVFDLSELEFIDSTGIGALVSCLRQAHGSEAEIRLCALTQPVQAVFDLVRLQRVFAIYNSPAEAINSYPN